MTDVDRIGEEPPRGTLTFPKGAVILVGGDDPRLHRQLMERLSTVAGVTLVQVGQAMEQAAQALEAGAVVSNALAQAFNEATRCSIANTPYQYVLPARLKQKAQWKQERSRVRRR